MRVGILTQYYPPEMGAAQSRLSDLAWHLQRRGHRVVVLTAMPNYPHGRVLPGYGGLARRERVADIDVIRTWIWPSASRRPIPRILSYLSFTISALVVGAVRLPRLDLLVTESPPLTLGLTGSFLATLKRARLVFNVSDLWPESAIALGMLREGSRSASLASWLERFSYRRAWAVSGQTRGILDSVRSRFPSVPTIPLFASVDTARFSPDQHSDEVRRELLGASRVVAVYAGLHGLAQGLDVVLDAADRLRDVEELSIVLVGDGPLKPALAREAADRGLANVRFLDAAPREEIPALLASADIALVPVVIPDAVPSKLYEAMASGIPVALMANGDAATIVESAGAGIAVAPGDAEGLARVLARLARSSEERTTMGAAARAAAVHDHDRRVICDRFIDALEGA